MSHHIVYQCIYGRHKPGKVRKEFQQDGKLFVTGREVTLVCDEDKDQIGQTTIPPHKDMPVPGKEILVGAFDVQVGDEYNGPAERPPPPEPPVKKFASFKAPVRFTRPDQSHPYAGVSRAVRRGGSFPRDENEAGGDGENKRNVNQLVTESEQAKPVPKKNKYSLFQ